MGDSLPHFDGNKLQLGHLVDGEEIVDEVLVCAETGQAEINIHGGPVASARSLKLLTSLGVTIIPPGKSDCLNLQYPSLANPAIGQELIDLLPSAPSPMAVTTLTSQWSGGISLLAHRIILDLDKGIIPPDAADKLRLAANGLDITSKLLTPPEVVIAGGPNTGKSTLVNYLTGRQVAIVSDIPGTTRDWIREKAMLSQVAVWITDTAGLWQTDHPVDGEAVIRAMNQIDQADLILLLKTQLATPLPEICKPSCPVIQIASMCETWEVQGNFDLAISTVENINLTSLVDMILSSLGLSDVCPETPTAFTARQATALNEAADCIDNSTLDQAREKLFSLLGRG